MATATTPSYGWVGIREDLVNRIAFADQDEYRLFPQLKKVPGTNRRHDWQTDTYTAGGVGAGVVEGAIVAFAAATARSLVSNFQQMFEKAVFVSSDLEAFSVAGVASEYAEQLRKRIVEIHKDYEATLLRGTSASGASDTARTMAGLGQVVTTNVSTSGANRDWDKTAHNALMQTTWQNGGRPDLVLAKPGAAIDFSLFPSAVLGGKMAIDALQKGSIYDFVKIIEDPFGRREVAVTNYHSTATATATIGVWYITKKELRVAEAIPLHEQPVQLGYHGKMGFLESMWTLEYGNEKYHATGAGISS